MADVNYVIEIDDSDALKALNQMKKGFNDVETSAKKAQAGVNGVFEDKNGRLREANGRYVKLKDTIGGVSDQFKKASSSGLSFWKLVGGSAVGNLASQAISRVASGIASIGTSAIKSAAQFEQFKVVLTNTLGSGSEAEAALNMITEFAANTPYQIEELTASFIKFANRGLKLTVEQMTNIGDLAASQGKSFDQLTEAILDAQSGEFERLKEFGVRATQANGKVTLAFKDQTVVVDKNNKAITEAILKFGQLQGVAGGMAAISQTLNGQISNLKDKFAILGKELGEEMLPAIKEIVQGIVEFLDNLDTKQIVLFFGVIKDQVLPALSDLYDTLKDVTGGLTDIDGNKIAENLLTVVDAVTLLVRGIDFIIDKAPGLRTLFTLIGHVANGLTLVIQDLAELTGGSAVKSYKQGLVELREETDRYLKAENALINSNNTIKTQLDLLYKKYGIKIKSEEEQKLSAEELAKAEALRIQRAKELVAAVDAMNSAYDQLRIRVRDSNTAQLDGLDLIKAENKNALEDIDKLQKQLEKLAKAAGKTLSQEAKNGLNDLRKNINENTAQQIQDYYAEIREFYEGVLKTGAEANEKQRQQRQEGIDNLKEGINKYYDFLEEDEVRRVGLINKSTDETLTLEEYREREILEIRIRYAKIRLKQLENDTTTEGAALRVSIQTTIDLAENELANFTPKKKDKDNFLVRFLKDQLSISSEEAEAIIAGITSSISYIYSQFAQSVADQTQAEIDRNQKLIDSLNERVEATKAALDEEYANQAKGSTNILQLKQTEYDKLKIQQEQAAAQAEILRKRQLKQQLNAETISQASSLLTSSANIIQSFSALPLGIGVALSAVVIGAMFAAFAANRAKAYELANQSAYTGGPMTQFLNGKSDRDGQRAYVVVDSDGKSVLNLGGNETIMNPSASSTYKGELAAMNKGVYKHRGVGEVAENRALSIGQKQTEIVQMREQMNYEEMKRVFGEVMIGYHEDYKKYNDKKEVFIPTKDGYISKKGLHTKKVRI